jgi:hypothetical protein
MPCEPDVRAAELTSVIAGPVTVAPGLEVTAAAAVGLIAMIPEFVAVTAKLVAVTTGLVVIVAELVVMVAGLVVMTNGLMTMAAWLAAMAALFGFSVSIYLLVDLMVRLVGTAARELVGVSERPAIVAP